MVDATPAAIPTLLLCGFLGSGKTTRINHLIRRGSLRDTLFLVNDFGRINIDAELIESRDENILRLENGCACCGIAGNLSAQLRDIKGWPDRPERLVFEASGIARPRPLMQLFDAARGYRLDDCETLIDASAFERHAGNAVVSDIFAAQIREVARLRINRVNWLDASAREHVLERITALNPMAQCLLEESERPAPTQRTSPSGPRPSAGPLITESLTLTHPVDVDALDALLAEAAPTLVRAKGLVDDATTRTHYVIQFAGGRTTRVATRARSTQALVLIGHPGDAFQSLLDSLRRL